MDGHNHDHMDGMNPPPSSTTMNNGTTMKHQDMMMHMTFFWGKDALVLFDGWPGRSTGKYVLCLIIVFFLAALTEWLGHCRIIKPGLASRSAGMLQTVVYTLRVGLAYLVMLALMSFNGGVFLVAVAGHALGFLIFGSRVFKDFGERKTADLPTSAFSC